MFFERLLGRLIPGFSDRIPTLYPGLNTIQLERFLTDGDYARIKSFDNAYILPFLSRNGEPAKKCFGFGLSRLLIRNLMLLRDISIRGPEDTPEAPFEAISGVIETRQRSLHVTGVANIGNDGYSLQVSVYGPGGPVQSTVVREANFAPFLQKCSTAVARLLGSKVSDEMAAAWSIGQPRDADSLIELGKIHLEFNRQQVVERGRAAKTLLNRDRAFVIPVWDYDDALPGARHEYLQALRRDPRNAQLCFLVFICLWKSKGPQPEALQFCRKAIELSPGHGKAHMCAPHAAKRPIDMLRHSELGYLLLPDNSFAANNYANALARARAPAAIRIEVCKEGIAADPRDPSGYLRLIELCSSLGDYRNALATAEQLQDLFEPTIDERALYCLRQNPQRARLIDSGKYDPAAENRRRIAELRRRVQGEIES